MKLSIITINYNSAEGLAKTIHSVIRQTYNDIEYIVIDGGSEDDSKGVIKANGAGIAYWVSEHDEGIYNAMNKGIMASTGDYLLFLNSGDVLMDKDVISEVFKQELTQDLICGNLIFDKESGPEEWIPADELTFKTFLYSTIPHPCTLIKRKVFDIVGMYNERNKIVSDWEFFLLAICRYNLTYRHLNIFMTIYSNGGVSSNPQNFIAINAERRAVLNTHFPYFLKDYEDHEALVKSIKKNKIHNKIKRFFKKF